jgi:uncharacterized protein YggT (Ycf19 family)
VLRPIRSLVKPINAGAMALDLSPIIAFVLLFVIQSAIGCGVLF